MENDNQHSLRPDPSAGPDAESTMIHTTTREEIVETEDGSKETLQEAMQLLTVKDYSEPKKGEAKQGGQDFMGLPTYLSTDDDYDFGMNEYITPSPAASDQTLQEK